MELTNNATLNTAAGKLKTAFKIAWLLGGLFYLMEYVTRSAPAVMLKELGDNFGIDNLRLSTVLGTYYYTYAITSLIAGMALDRFGGKYAIAIGCFVLGAGCVIFSLSSVFAADTGRLLQGAGSAFAFTGCVYLASHGFEAKYIATAIGFTQCMGMLGGSAGQFVVGPMMQGGLGVKEFWVVTGIICLIISVLLLLITPQETKKVSDFADKAANDSGAALRSTGRLKTDTVNSSGDNSGKMHLLAPYKIVFSNSQSYLSGIISGLLFAPTTVFAMTWGVAFFQHDRQVNSHDAVLICAMVPMGWVIGCPLVGWISDTIGRRKPVLAGSILVMLISYAQLLFAPEFLPPLLTMLFFGIASGSAMIPYSIIKEANPDQVKGSATGAQNFLTFSITVLIGPVFAYLYGKNLLSSGNPEHHFQMAGIFFLGTTLLALLLTWIIRETGTAVKIKKLINSY
jgi:MFS family permease